MALRLVDWDVRLVGYVDSVRGTPLVWGRTDCASLVRGAVRAMYDRDVLRGVGSWTTSTGALRVLARWGGSYRAALEVAGVEDVPVPFRQRGDVAILPGVDSEGFPGLGVVVAGGVLTVAPGNLVDIVSATNDDLIDVEIVRFPNGP